MSEYQHIINNRRLIGGERSQLMAISPMKHVWAREYWNQMRANNWNPEEVDLSRDVPCYRNELTEEERNMFDKALAFLSNLDGIQLHNLTDNIAQHVTSPEVKMVLTRQAYEEALHVDSYSVLAEAISADPMAIYMTFMRDEILARKNEYITRQSAKLKDDGSPRSYALAVVANVALEGIYFYSGFLSFFGLAKRGKMLGAADMIRFIMRDEVVHKNFFATQFDTLKQENPEVFVDPIFWADAVEILKAAVELETDWGVYITNGVLGFTPQVVGDYIKHLGNDAAALLGMEPIYPGVKNPCEWVDKFSQINKDETNFFEGKVKSYQVGTLGW
ncbi:ribonucleotide-diphosphate reductase subunit beta [Chromobacterium phragmitis]|uniref:Ribonucleoside-diphosphate reductase subunit beta n=1 Tax=Chromobacterium phragmitis TaxID=2202141 RepID=A0ABV0J0Y3_9NEIS